MDRSPSKRVLTETTLDSRSVIDGSTRNDGVSGELRALLRNSAARVRKSVMEGYSVDRTAPLMAQNAHTDARVSVAGPAEIFQSSRDINDRVLKDWTPSPFSSPKKRSRYNYEADDAPEEEEEEGGMEIDLEGANLQTLVEDRSQRPIKPLRRTLFADASTASKPSIPRDHVSYADHVHDASGLENPFLSG